VPILPGKRLGPYEILSAIGAGGMGEVYRARDAKLGRDVALKVLPEAFARDAERMARFQREAKVLASLNHPNIASIYGMEDSGGTDALVMEMVEGPTLADRIRQGPIPTDEALRIAKQICEALEYAHERGIVHRDLKPANVKVTNDDAVKILDFGLAKALEGDGSSADVANSPTITHLATQVGVLLGTAAYMSPEQAKGKPVDRRADIWAFGCVLYEMLTGKMVFGGETVTDTLAAIIKEEPDWSQLPAGTPIRVRVLLQRCLQKDPKQRLRDIGDARILLEEPTASAENTRPANKRLAIALGAIALASMIAAGVFAVLHFGERPNVARPVRFEIPAEGSVDPYLSISVSPNGDYLAFLGVNANSVRVFQIRALDSLQTQTIPNSEGAGFALAWSPDSSFLTFVAGQNIKRAAVAGGPAETLSDVGYQILTASWKRDGTIFFAGSGVTRIAESGGAPTTVVPAGSGILGLHFLPDEQHFLFSAGDASVPGTTLGIFAGSIDNMQSVAKWNTSTPLVTSDTVHFAFAPVGDASRGYLFFIRDGALVAQGFDTRKLEVVGPPVIIAENVVEFGASSDVLAYRTGNYRTTTQLRWFDRHGKQTGTVGEAGNVGDIWISRDGKTVLIDRVDSATNHVWLGDTARGVFSRLTSTSTNETAGSLAPDGTVVFTMSHPGVAGDLYAVRPNSSAPELLLKSEFLKHANDISPDGKYLIYDMHGTQRQDLYVLPLNIAGAKPVPFLATPADETFGQFSPEGKWVAYTSDESGRREVYVRAFLPGQDPAAGARKWLVSTAGGSKPRWSRDGKELYYIAQDGKIMATPVRIGDTFEPGIPVPLFDVHTAGFFPYDVSADGRFLINTPVETAQATSAPITVVLNWSAALKK